jgi:hypothetical protein
MTRGTGVDRRLHDVGVAALAAVSQYPRAVDNAHGDLMVSEVFGEVNRSVEDVSESRVEFKAVASSSRPDGPFLECAR